MISRQGKSATVQLCTVEFSCEFLLVLETNSVAHVCVLGDAAMSHPYFRSVFADLTCHSCQQTQRDLLANGATARAPCD